MTHNTHPTILMDQKLVNEELIVSIAEVARINVQHCAELFEIPLSVAQRIRDLDAQAQAQPQFDRLLDLATTPAPLWRLSVTSSDLQRMSSRKLAMFSTELETYRPVVARLNRMVIGMLVRYANDPIQAALVCGVSSTVLIKEVQDSACIALLDCAGNPGRPLIETRITQAMLDRFFITCNGQPAEAQLRGLVAATSCSALEFSILDQEIESGAWGARQVFFPQESTPKRTGKIPVFLLKPEDSQLVIKLLAYRVKPIDVERWMADRGLRALQLERLQAELFPHSKDSREVHSIWGNATRRLLATAVLLKQRALIRMGMHPLNALVEAFDFQARHHDQGELLNLSRLLKEVVIPMFSGGSIHLNHCTDCNSVHISNEERISPMDCPVCCLVYRKRLGHQRRWKHYIESHDRIEALPLAA